MYFGQGGFHMNLNVIDKETLQDAMEHPDKYPQLTIRVSGYAVNFVRLTQGAAAGRDQPDLPRPDLRGASRHAAARRPRTRQPARPARRHLARRAGRVAAPMAATGAFGYAHSYETSSRYDGPGLRIVLFVSGCLLRCTYCHNPDTWHLKDGTYVSARFVARPAGGLRAGAARRSMAG